MILQLLSYLTIEASVLDSLSVQFSNTISPNHKSSCSPLLKSTKGAPENPSGQPEPKEPFVWCHICCGSILWPLRPRGHSSLADSITITIPRYQWMGKISHKLAINACGSPVAASDTYPASCWALGELICKDLTGCWYYTQDDCRCRLEQTSTDKIYLHHNNKYIPWRPPDASPLQHTKLVSPIKHHKG